MSHNNWVTVSPAPPERLFGAAKRRVISADPGGRGEGLGAHVCYPRGYPPVYQRVGDKHEESLTFVCHDDSHVHADAGSTVGPESSMILPPNVIEQQPL